MTDQVKTHETVTSLVNAAPAEVDAGADLALQVRVACSSGCDLHGLLVQIIAQDIVAKEIELVTLEETACVTDEFVVKVPTQPGEYAWAAVFPEQEQEGLSHAASSAPFSFIVKPHVTSMAVWDVPSPVVVNGRFKASVGVRCSAECKLTGQRVEIYDHQGALVATAALGDAPLASTSALYWTEVELTAPGTAGYHTWTARFSKPDLELAHEGSAGTLAFVAAPAPEHVVIVEAFDRATGAPLTEALVALQSTGAPYREHTDDAGVARLFVPKGTYEVNVLKEDYQDWEGTVEVAGDAQLKAEVTYWPGQK